MSRATRLLATVLLLGLLVGLVGVVLGLVILLGSVTS